MNDHKRAAPPQPTAKLNRDIDHTIDALEAQIRGSMPSRSADRETGGAGRNPTHHIPFTEPEPLKQRILWSSVGLVTCMIFGLWGWHMYTVIYDTSHDDAHAAATPFQTVGQEFSEAMKIATPADTAAPAATSTAPEESALVVGSEPSTTLDTLAQSLQDTISGATSPTSVTHTP